MLTMRLSSPSSGPSTQDPKRKPVIKIEQQISLQELARRMNLKATEVLMKLLQLGGVGKNINSTLDADTATLLASEFGFTVEDVALDTDAIIKKALAPDTIQDLSPRPPVVTVMGHVDHGKTTLLDAVLGMRVAEGEAGGITQEVRAYKVITPRGPVVFFDTPGHEAFTALRMRGAKTTDVAVLVVAADDGVMPTTVEAINHAKAAKVPIVVALNKIDKPDANPDKVLQQLLQYDVIPEEFGGTVLVRRVSAKNRTGITELLEDLALQTELLDLKANAKKAGVGTVFESKLDKGRGAVARVLVQEGIIRNGDIVLAGTAYGRIRAMFDDRGKAIDKAGPSTPIEILGLNEPPTAGDKIYVCADARKAQEAAEQIKAASKKAPIDHGPKFDVATYLSQNATINVNVVIKADAQGAVEGLKKALTELSTDKVKVSVLHAAVGAITETDVQLAVPSHAVIIGFNVRPAGKAAAVAEDQKIIMRFYNVIYEAVDDIKLFMVGQLKPTLIEKPQGKAEIRQVFNITKVGIIAGCMVVDGAIKRGALVRLIRDGAVKWEGKIGTLRRIKDDVKEVTQGFECGIGLDNSPDMKPGDMLEAYELEEVAAVL
jgi:translation initiation factor IF-2